MIEHGAKWFMLNSGPGEAGLNMALDEALLLGCAELGAPVLRFYGWSEAAATFGYFQKYAEVSAWTGLRPLIRRPTGGGLVPHTEDWTYSLAIPPQHEWYKLKATESYERVHQWIADSLRTLSLETRLAPEARKEVLGQCFIGAEKFDLLHEGSKIAGAAQRRLKEGLLIQGSLQQQPRHLKRAEWEAAMLKVAAAQWSVHWKPLPNVEQFLVKARELDASKYSQAAYNQSR